MTPFPLQILRMKPRLNNSWPVPRARFFAREILLASAITLAALIMFLIAGEPTEVAEMKGAPEAATEQN